MTNYRFTKGNEANTIVLKINGNRLLINQETLTNDLAELVLNTPGISHNIELIPGHTMEKKNIGTMEEVPLPESIVSALQDAGIEEKPSKDQPKKKESDLNTSKQSMEKNTQKKKGKK